MLRTTNEAGRPDLSDPEDERDQHFGRLHLERKRLQKFFNNFYELIVNILNAWPAGTS